MRPPLMPASEAASDAIAAALDAAGLFPPVTAVAGRA